MSAPIPSPSSRLHVPLLAGVFIIACTGGPSSNAPVTSDVLFRDLAAYLAADFPSTPERLQACRSADNTACVQAHERVQRAREALLAGGQESAAKRMLTVLSHDCAGLAAEKLSSSEVPAALERCRGAGVALSLVDEPLQDARFRRFFSFQVLELRGLVLATGGEPWAHGRREPA
ncbi:MAG: hypothetical protein L0Y66_00650, partial [Myxococcaceae bacterium]|nr:hypothetical protein [Myxococcaceae bacterium]